MISFRFQSTTAFIIPAGGVVFTLEYARELGSLPIRGIAQKGITTKSSKKFTTVPVFELARRQSHACLLKYL